MLYFTNVFLCFPTLRIGALFRNFMKNGQYISTKITINCSCEIYPIKSHVLFTHAGKILHSHNWPDMWTENEIAYIDESESLINRPSVQRFCISRGTNTRFWSFAEWNHGCLSEKIFGEFIKNNMLCSLPWCVWRYRTFLNNTVEHVLKKCGHSERPSSKSGQCSKGIFAWSWRYSTKWNDSNKT